MCQEEEKPALGLVYKVANCAHTSLRTSSLRTNSPNSRHYAHNLGGNLGLLPSESLSIGLPPPNTPLLAPAAETRMRLAQTSNAHRVPTPSVSPHSRPMLSTMKYCVCSLQSS